MVDSAVPFILVDYVTLATAINSAVFDASINIPSNINIDDVTYTSEVNDFMPILSISKHKNINPLPLFNQERQGWRSWAKWEAKPAPEKIGHEQAVLELYKVFDAVSALLFSADDSLDMYFQRMALFQRKVFRQLKHHSVMRKRVWVGLSHHYLFCSCSLHIVFRDFAP